MLVLEINEEIFQLKKKNGGDGWMRLEKGTINKIIMNVNIMEKHLHLNSSMANIFLKKLLVGKFLPGNYVCLQ